MSKHYIRTLVLLLWLSGCEVLEISNEIKLSLDECPDLVIGDVEVAKIEEVSYQVNTRFSTSESSEVVVFYKPTSEKHYYRTELSSTGIDHELQLTLLRPATDYDFFVASVSSDCRFSKSHSFTTNPLPEGVTNLHLARDQSYPQEGGFILTHVRIAEPRLFFLTDQSGSIVWYHFVKEGSPKVFSITEDNTIVSMIGDEPSLLKPADKIIEIDLNGNIINRINNIEKELHHDIIKKDGKYHAITYETRTVDLSSIGGKSNERILGDGILVLDESGNKVWEWSVFDVKDPKLDPAILKRKLDWLHMNSLWLDENGDYYLSFRNTDGIWKVDGKNGNLLWESYPDRLSGQHALHTIGDRLALFNNGLDRSASSYEEYAVSATSRISSDPIVTVDLPNRYFTYVMGSGFRIDNHILFCSTINGSLVISDLHGNITWLAEGSFYPFKAYFIAKPYPSFKQYLP